MEITTQLDGEEMRIELRGRLDAAWSPTVNKALQDTIQNGCHQIALDLSQVNYLSSAGIRVLVIAAKKLNAISGNLRLIAASPQVTEVLQLVGINQLFNHAANTAQPVADNQVRHWQHGDYPFAVYELHKNALQQGRVLANETVTINECTWVIGQGVLGKETGEPNRDGELLALHSLAINLPCDDPEHPDWLLREGGLVPEVTMQHGLQGEGAFRYLLRFGATPNSPALPLSALADAALAVCEADTVAIAMLAETAQLVGACKQQPSDARQGFFFEFPVIRDHLLFTAEPAYCEDTCLIIGVIAKQPAPDLAAQLRPISEGSPLYAHFHACIVPFQPVPKDYIDLGESLDSLLKSQRIRGVLHLLNDDREGIGAGESQLRRGAVWCAAINFNEDGV